MSQDFRILKLWHAVVADPTEQMVADAGLTSTSPSNMTPIHLQLNKPDTTTTTTTILRPFFQDHLGEPVPEENFWTSLCKGRLTEAETPTIWLGATPSGLTSAHLHDPPFFTGRMPFPPP